MDPVIKKLKQKRLFLILSIIIGIAAYILGFVFFGWKLILVLFMFDFYKNLGDRYIG